MKILFICTDNISRSPMAEAIFRHLTKLDGTEDQFMCQSAGIGAVKGEKIEKNAEICLEEIGIDISDHRSRKLTTEELEVWDAYFTMSETHAYILQQSGIPRYKIYTPKYITDPYGKCMEIYKTCLEKIIAEVEKFYMKLVMVYGTA